MDKSKVEAVLAPYVPPLSPTQVEAIATEIERISKEEIDDIKKVGRRQK